MAKLLVETTQRIDQLEQEIQASYEQLGECQEMEALNQQLAIVDRLTQQLTGLTHELAGLLDSLPEPELAEAIPLLHRLKSLLQTNLEQASEQRELAKQGILGLRQTAAGAAAYQAVKKQR